MSKKFGIDISVYQRNMDLMKAKAEGVEFAILRAGFTGYGTGVSKNKDNSFENLYTKCKYLAIPVGAYWYSCATDYEKGKAEAEFMYEYCLKGKQFEYPIYIDVEDSHYQQKAGKKKVTEAIKGFCEYLEAKGFYVGIYANVNWFNNYIDTPALSMYDKWVACWGKERPENPSGGMWQFGGETNLIRTNKIAGVTCDQDYSFYDFPSIMKEKGLNGFGKSSEIVSKPEPKEIKYTVKSGDTLSSVAAKYNTSYQKIYQDNKATIDNENKKRGVSTSKMWIYPNQVLVIK